MLQLNSVPERLHLAAGIVGCNVKCFDIGTQAAKEVSTSIEEGAQSMAEQTPQVAALLSKKIESGAKEVEKQVSCHALTRDMNPQAQASSFE